MNTIDIYKSEEIVLTLDAGGTNFVFTAIQAGRELVPPISRCANTDNLELCLQSIKDGFEEIRSQLNASPVAISFAFPGPADYENGVIGNLPNFTCFNEGVPLKNFLQDHFQIPVFINNDGNLFAYGEALCGSLPDINTKLREAGNTKQYKNLLGITFGTGFGAGVVINGELLLGDNGCGGDVWVFRNKKYADKICEESVSIRAIKRVYGELSGYDASELTPKDIFDIAEGCKEGDRLAAIKSFEEFGEIAANTISEALTIVDGLVVLGGGLTGAAKYYMPALMREMNATIGMFDGSTVPRLQMNAYWLDDQVDMVDFVRDDSVVINRNKYNSQPVIYRTMKKTGIVHSSLGASKAISLGAYAYALNMLQK